MEDFLTNAVIWFIIGLAFFLFEFVAPGFILFFFGVGTWIVAILALFLDISLTYQLVIFLGSSVLTAVLFRKWVRDKLGMYKESNQTLEDEFIGKTGIAETDISSSVNGKVDFKGTSWDACSDDNISAGENVLITGNRSILLIVKSKKTL